MDHLLRLNIYARLAIALCLSLCVHLALLLIPSARLPGASYLSGMGLSSSRLTVLLSGPSIVAARQIAENSSSQDPPDLTAKANQKGGRLAASGSNPPQRLDRHYFVLAEPGAHLTAVLDIRGHPPELLDQPEKTDVIMRLWIDRTGRAIRVEPVTQELSQTFIDSARDRLLNATFSLDRKPKDASIMTMDVVLRYSQME